MTPSPRSPLVRSLPKLLIAFALLLALPARAATVTWSNVAGGNWSLGANWSTASVPSAGDDVVLPDLGGAYTVSLDANASVTTLSVGAGATLSMSQGDSLTLMGRALNNDGKILIGPGSANTLHVRDSTWINGSGEIKLSGQGRISSRFIRPVMAIWLFNGVGHTIRGDGDVWLPIVNRGMIRHDGTGSRLLTLWEKLYNYGTVRVTGGGKINVHIPLVKNYGGRIEGSDGKFTVEMPYGTGSNWGPIDNLNGGTFVADGGDLRIDAGTIAEGSIQQANGAGAVVIDETANFQNLVVEQGAELRVEGLLDLLVSGSSLLNHGTVRVRGTVQVGPGSGHVVTAAGGGSWVLEAGRIDIPNGTFVNDFNHTITGCGEILGDFVNNGTLNLDCPTGYGDLGSGALTNRGTIRVQRGYMRASGTTAVIANFGTIDGGNGGIIVQQGARLENWNGGTLIAGRSHVQLGYRGTASTLVGGTLRSVNGGTFQNGGQTALQDVTLAPGTTFYSLNRSVTTATGASFVNRGLNQVEAGGTFMTGASTEYVQPDGVTMLRGGTLAVPRGLTVRGSLAGAGTVVGKVVNEGEVAPGASATGLQVQGDYAQAKSARLAVGIGGYADDQFGRLVVSGNADLDGSVRATRTGGFAPANGHTFEVLTSATRSGEFAVIEADQGLLLTPLYEPERVTLSTPFPLGVDDPAQLPRVLRLAARGAAFALELPEAAEVDVRAFDVMGREVAVLANGARPAGVHVLAMRDALPSGVYFARAIVRTGGRSEVREARLVHVR